MFAYSLLIEEILYNFFLTPRKAMINTNFFGDVIDLDDKQVKVNSLDQHPTESCHQKVLQQGCYCNTGTLQGMVRNGILLV